MVSGGGAGGEDGYERRVFDPVVDRAGMSAICSILNEMHDRFREMSPPWHT